MVGVTPGYLCVKIIMFYERVCCSCFKIKSGLRLMKTFISRYLYIGIVIMLSVLANTSLFLC